ncbi:MAG TPA: alpha/beta fold hydrolase [Byssovorax sp.]|jgi:pimeloyl-ACP methyl ester carboxylesterase
MGDGRTSARRVDVGEVELSVTTGGDGPLVVLLHGFPECSYTWRHVLPRLVDAGFSVAAPDLRGYRASDRPQELGAYAIDKLVGDVAGLAKALGSERIHLVGHDWGGTLAFAVAERHPELVDKLCVIDGAHPELYRTGMWHGAQLLRSWYVFFFQLPALPELLVRSRFYLERVMRGAAPAAFPDDAMQLYVDAMQGPGAATAGIDYYRAASKIGLSAPGIIQATTHVLWGDHDEALSQELLTGLDRYAPGVTVKHFPGASHWLQEEHPDDVSDELLRFFRAPS